MSQLNLPAAYGQIEDQLDAVGQRWRIVQIVRGLILWSAWAIVSLVAATMLAAAAGQGKISVALLSIWIAWIIFSAILWIVRPMLLRPRPRTDRPPCRIARRRITQRPHQQRFAGKSR